MPTDRIQIVRERHGWMEEWTQDARLAGLEEYEAGEPHLHAVVPGAAAHPVAVGALLWACWSHEGHLLEFY